jgi:hypothetical protein
LEVTVPAVTLKVVLIAPVATETDWGTARHTAELLSARIVVEAAAALSVTVHAVA